MINKKLWIIDDDPIFRLIFSMTIKKVNQTIDLIEYENGKKALEAFQQIAKEKPENLPYMLVVDLNMPEMNGWQFLDELEKIDVTHDLKMPHVFVVSSSIDKEDMAKIKDYPFASGYISKPVTANVIKPYLI